MPQKITRMLLILGILTGSGAATNSQAEGLILPFCKFANSVIEPADARRIQQQGDEWRKLAATHILMPDNSYAWRLKAFQTALNLPAGVGMFDRISEHLTREQTLDLMNRLSSDKDVYLPILKAMEDIPPDLKWALYLNTGYYAIANFSSGQRDMNALIIDEIQKRTGKGSGRRHLDIGIGNGILLISYMLQNPSDMAYGIDVAGAAVNVSTWGLTQVGDILRHKHNDSHTVGRFLTGFASGLDTELLPPAPIFDSASMVLTLFALNNRTNRSAAVGNMAKRLKPGAIVGVIDPTQTGLNSEGANMLQKLVVEAYENNPNATFMDLMVLIIQNSHNLFSTQFMNEPELLNIFSENGLKSVEAPRRVYYGTSSLYVFEYQPSTP